MMRRTRDVAAILMFAISATRGGEGDAKTALHRAALYGDAGKVRELLAGGADVNATDKDGATPLLCALRFGGRGASSQAKAQSKPR